MAITFPLALLGSKVLTKSFDLVFRQSISRLAGGSAIGADFGLPIWRANYVTGLMSVDDCVDIEAQLQALEGAVNTFLARDLRRPFPRGYQTGAFTDSGVVSALGGDGKSLTISGLPASFAIARGDYFQITTPAGVPKLYRAGEAVMANGSGLTASFAALPHYDPSITTGSAVVFKNPSCLMRLEPGSIQFNDAGRALGTVSFSATQS